MDFKVDSKLLGFLLEARFIYGHYQIQRDPSLRAYEVVIPAAQKSATIADRLVVSDPLISKIMGYCI